MRQPTSNQLFAYWDHLRNGRIAPRRFDIEPAGCLASASGWPGRRFARENHN
ncbi:MAG: PAS domain-containing protein [Alphaproteobacteria bacterium]